MSRYRPSSLDSYRRDLSDVEPLDADTEHRLAIAWKAGDREAGERLVRASLPFVIKIAKEYRRWGIPMEDLIQQGNLGLLRAAAKFDPEQKCRLITYAVYWIRAEIREYVVRGYRIVRLGTTRTERKAMRAYRRDDITTVEELAELSGMPLARAKKLWPILTQRDFALDAELDERGPAVDRLRDAQESPEDACARAEAITGVRARLGEALALLSDRERRIVEQRLLTDEPRTLESLGEEFGVSKERVRQLEARARGKLRGALSAYEPVAA
ncbi:MAG TPA: sigma-70 family RNA polymerase sigma factor [Sandaracinaceae bacterium LLY-WYZ-13_1]|nr:sigma-70 family RNA polymerase sigma factor [Sandaracinaceae bacterium LLY-WYZ-13_1]